MARTITTKTSEVEQDEAVRTPSTAGGGDDRRVRKVEDLIWFLIAIVIVLIFVRFLLLLFGARTGVPFVDFWYGITAPLIAPFAGMFGNIDTYNTYTGQRIELEALVGMVVYGLVGYLIVLGVRLLRREPKSQ